MGHTRIAVITLGMVDLVLPLSLLLYVVVPTLLLMRGLPIRAGLAMIAVALLPWVIWTIAVPKPWGPGAGIALLLTAVQLLLALLPLLIGLTALIVRHFREEAR